MLDAEDAVWGLVPPPQKESVAVDRVVRHVVEPSFEAFVPIPILDFSHLNRCLQCVSEQVLACDCAISLCAASDMP